MIVYVDSEKHCHIADDGYMTHYDLEFFDGKCDEFVEGYCYDTENNAVYPWRDIDELDAAQREYEREQIADMENALAILLGGDAV